MFLIGEKVLIKNVAGRYTNVRGTVVFIHTDIKPDPVYIVQYDKPFENIKRGMYQESDLDEYLTQEEKFS